MYTNMATMASDETTHKLIKECTTCSRSGIDIFSGFVRSEETIFQGSFKGWFFQWLHSTFLHKKTSY